MKKNLIYTILLVVLIASYFIAGEYESKIAWQNFDTGISTSKKMKKKMIVDVYTTWCGWCKKMESTTYSDKEVSDYIKTKYIASKINAESQDKVNYMGTSYSEQDLARAFGISGYPSTVFLDENQKPITVIPGYIDAKEFKYILKYINEDIYKTKTYAEYKKSSKL